MKGKSTPIYLQADYIDAKIRQSMMWANGKPEHDHVYSECCADFSCCFPDLFEQDEKKRWASHEKFLIKLFDRRDKAIERVSQETADTPDSEAGE